MSSIDLELFGAAGKILLDNDNVLCILSASAHSLNSASSPWGLLLILLLSWFLVCSAFLTHASLVISCSYIVHSVTSVLPNLFLGEVTTACSKSG